MAEESIKISIDQEESFYIENGDYDKTLRTIIQEHKNKEKNGNILQLKSVRDICKESKNFYIASYQRGYRWGKDEVNALLEDIYEVYVQGDKAPKYCLQPLVVKKRDNAMCTKTLGELDESGKVENSQEIGQACYELLDGQQRLTTLWLILDALKEKLPSEQRYSIYYELVRKVDENFICNAKDTIKCWFGCHDEFKSKAKKYKREGNEKDLDWKEDERQDYKKIILDKLYFIWYEVKDEKTNENELLCEEGQSTKQGQSEKLFRKINKGKIELTNAELFKAMLLNEENARTEEERGELVQISFEWDKIEQSLRNDDFWYFVSNDKSEERTRIDYILEVYARGKDDGKFDVTKDRYSFLVVQDYLLCKKDNAGNIDFESIKTVWKDIVSVHDKLYSWYQDNELYHNIGFLVANEGKRCAAAAGIVVKLYQNGKDKGIQEVKKMVRGEIYNRLIVKKWKATKGGNNIRVVEEEYELENLTFEGDKKYLANGLLLYSNIFPLLDQGRGKFPFKAYYSDSWDIEHINPQKKESDIKKLITWGKSENNGEADGGKDEIDSNFNWVRNVELILEYLKKKNKNTEPLPELKEEDKNQGFCQFSGSESGKGFLKDMQNAWNECSIDGGVDVINNFVLLNSKINRGYHNALFNQKRAKIIEYDKNGFFIPMATKNVFLKYYNENPAEFIEWGKEDQKGYLNYLEELFKKVKSWEKYSQKAGKSINE